jgi:hypothetical protein
VGRVTIDLRKTSESSETSVYQYLIAVDGLEGFGKPQPVEPPELGPISMEPMVGGLHHRYYRQVA